MWLRDIRRADRTTRRYEHLRVSCYNRAFHGDGDTRSSPANIYQRAPSAVGYDCAFDRDHSPGHTDHAPANCDDCPCANGHGDTGPCADCNGDRCIRSGDDGELINRQFPVAKPDHQVRNHHEVDER